MQYEVRINRDAIEKVLGQAAREYPDECCGIITGNAAGQTVHECENIQNRLFEEDPARHPRNARTAYTIERSEADRIFAEAGRKGEDVLAFYHSHTDHDAYFSETDREVQTIFGEPEYPDALHLVVSVKEGKTERIKTFRWDRAKKDFVSDPSE